MRMEDDQIKAVLQIKKDFVVSTGWQIESPDGDVKDWAEKTFAEMDASGTGLDYSFDDSLRDMLSSIDYGFSLTEPVFGLDNDGLWTVNCMKTRPPHSFRFEIDDRGNVLEIVQDGAREPLRFKPGKFIHHVYQPDFGNPFGRSDLRGAYKAWKSKLFVQKWMAMYLERFASPTVLGRYNSNMDANEVSEFHEHLKRIQNVTAMAIPEDVQIEFKEAQKDGSGAYIKAIEHYNLMIARAVLVPDLIGIGGSETSGGSFALGEKHFQLFLNVIQGLRKSLERKITLKLLKPLITVNFGDVPCEFKFKPFTEDITLDYFRVWNEAVKGRVFKPSQEQIDHFNSSLGFPEGAEILEEQPPAPAGAEPGQPQPGDQDDPEGAPSPDLKPEPIEDNVPFSHKHDEVRSFREKSSFEQKVNFAAIEKVLDNSERDARKQLDFVGKKIMSDFLDKVRPAFRRKDVKRINEVQPSHLREMKNIWKAHFSELYKDSFDRAQGEIQPEAPKRFAEDGSLLPEEFLAIIDQEAFDQVGKYAVAITKKARTALVQGIKDGVGEAELFKVARESMKAESDQWLHTVISTKTTEMFNEARKSYFENDEFAKEVVVAYQWSAILDSRTSDFCRFMDQKIFDKGDFANRVKPPAHFNCRSVLTAVTRFENHKKDPKYLNKGKLPSDEALRARGGSLLSLPKAKKFARGDVLVASGSVEGFGDHTLVAAPPAGKRLVIFGITASNLSIEDPINIGFRSDPAVGAMWKNTLAPRGGTFQKEFPDGHAVEEASPFLVNLSAHLGIDYTIEYAVQGIQEAKGA